MSFLELFLFLSLISPLFDHIRVGAVCPNQEATDLLSSSTTHTHSHVFENWTIIPHMENLPQQVLCCVPDVFSFWKQSRILFSNYQSFFEVIIHHTSFLFNCFLLFFTLLYFIHLLFLFFLSLRIRSPLLFLCFFQFSIPTKNQFLFSSSSHDQFLAIYSFLFPPSFFFLQLEKKNQDW